MSGCVRVRVSVVPGSLCIRVYIGCTKPIDTHQYHQCKPTQWRNFTQLSQVFQKQPIKIIRKIKLDGQIVEFDKILSNDAKLNVTMERGVKKRVRFWADF